MRVYDNILQLIGNTPLVRINKSNSGLANVFAKVEYFNPAGSIKDRVALNMIETAEKLKLQENVERFYKEPDKNVGDVKVVYTDFNISLN